MMKAIITPLLIPSIEDQSYNTNDMISISQNKKFNSRTTLIYILIFIANIVVSMDLGAIILYDNNLTYFYMLYPLSFIGNLICSIFSIKLINRFTSKMYIVISLILFMCSLSLFLMTIIFFTSSPLSPYILNLSRCLIGISQTFITIFSIQWCQYFSMEKSRLSTIETLQLSAPLGILIGFLCEINLQSLSFYIQIISIAVIFICIISIPSNKLGNPTRQLTDHFLRKTMTNTYEEMLNYIPLIIFQLILNSFLMFIFAMIFFYKATLIGKDYGNVVLGKTVSFCALGIATPFLGLVIGGYIPLLCGTYFNNFINFIFASLGLCFGIISHALKTPSIIAETVYLGLMVFFYMATKPLVFNSINQMIISNETREFIFATMLFSSNLFGLGGGTIIGGLYYDNINDILFYSSIAYFVLFLVFHLHYAYKIQTKQLDTSPLYEYQLYILISSSFGRFSLFIWDDYKGDSLIDQIKEPSFEVKLSNEDINVHAINIDNDQLFSSFQNPKDVDNNKKENDNYLFEARRHSSDNGSGNDKAGSAIEESSLRPSQMTFNQLAMNPHSHRSNNSSKNKGDENNDNSFEKEVVDPREDRFTFNDDVFENKD